MGGAVWQSIVFEKHWLQDWKGFLIKQQQMLKAFDTLIFILLLVVIYSLATTQDIDGVKLVIISPC